MATIKAIAFSAQEHAQVIRALELSEQSARRQANGKSLLPFAKDGYVAEANALAALRIKIAGLSA